MITNTYLLTDDYRGNQHVVEYTPAEMEELFTYEQRKGLARGDWALKGSARFVDMLVATRAAVRL